MPVQAASWQENREVGELFKNVEVQSTFVLYDVASQTYIGHDEARANRRFIPASTFKIPNTLIGLSVGAVKSEITLYPTGPRNPSSRPGPGTWVLREAIALSNVRYYQELARRIGLLRMREGVAALDYGNKEIGTAWMFCWLNGPLRISAVEQTRLPGHGWPGAVLPLPAAVQQSVRKSFCWNAARLDPARQNRLGKRPRPVGLVGRLGGKEGADLRICPEPGDANPRTETVTWNKMGKATNCWAYFESP